MAEKQKEWESVVVNITLGALIAVMVCVVCYAAYLHFYATGFLAKQVTMKETSEFSADDITDPVERVTDPVMQEAAVTVVAQDEKESKFTYKNASLGFRMTFPSQRWSAARTSTEKMPTLALHDGTCVDTIDAHDACPMIQIRAGMYKGDHETTQRALEERGQSPELRDEVLMGGTVLKMDAPDHAALWSFAYEVIMPNGTHYMVLTNNEGAERTILPTLRTL